MPAWRVSVPVSLVVPHEAGTALLVPASPLDPDQVHYVEAGVPEVGLSTSGLYVVSVAGSNERLAPSVDAPPCAL